MQEGKVILEKCKIVGVEEGDSPMASSLGNAFDTMSLLSGQAAASTRAARQSHMGMALRVVVSQWPIVAAS